MLPRVDTLASSLRAEPGPFDDPRAPFVRKMTDFQRLEYVFDYQGLHLLTKTILYIYSHWYSQRNHSACFPA